MLIFKEPLLELTIHGHGSKYTVLSGSMKPQKILANTVFMKRNCKHSRAKNNFFFSPYPTNTLKITQTQKSFSRFENGNFFFFSFNKIHILQFDEFSVLLCYFQRILNSDCFEAF